MWPEIPNDITSLSAAQARDFARQIRLHAKEVVESDPSDEQLAEATEWAAKRDALLAHAAQAEQIERDRADHLARLSEIAADETADADPEPEPTPEAPSTVATAAPAPAPVSAPVAPAPVPAAPASVDLPVTPETTGFAPSKLLARDGVAGHTAGAAFGSWTDVAQALQAKARNLRANSSEKFEVAYIPARFPEGSKLTENMAFNLRLFEQDEIMAEMCAPPIPLYDLACENTLRRPVAGSLRAFQPDQRGAVTVYPSPSLSDITTGVGQWTNVEDSDPEAEKDPCQTIECATPEEYRLYGVYRCLTVKNLLAMTFPELVEAYLNRLGAAHARLAETLLLEGMGNSAATVAAPALGYNGSVSVTSTVLNYLALYQEAERWDLPGLMPAWLPRWVLLAMKMDMIRRRSSDGGRIRVPSDAEITTMFNEVGVSPTFFIDTPSWATPVPAVETGGTLNLLPAQVEILVAPPGKFAMMDRGELSIGVTGNNIYRDNQSNARNEFTFFFENFEAPVDTTSCPAHILEIPACWNGIQIADAVLNCEGVEVTEGS